MHPILWLIAAVATYEGVAWLSRNVHLSKSKSELYEDAAKHRVRLINQQGETDG